MMDPVPVGDLQVVRAGYNAVLHTVIVLDIGIILITLVLNADTDFEEYGGDDETGIVMADGMSIDNLIWHASDTAVKPIVANRRIERLPEPRYDPRGLPFTAMSLQEMLNAEQKDLENFLTHIYRAIASAAPLKDKVRLYLLR